MTVGVLQQNLGSFFVLQSSDNLLSQGSYYDDAPVSELSEDETTTTSHPDRVDRNRVTPLPAAGNDTNNSMIGPNDVVCGRDKIAHTHNGNKRFRKIVQQYREKYQNAKRREDKTRITSEIAAIVQQQGGRFLKYDETLGAFAEVDSIVVHEKVSHALRSARDPELACKRRQRSSTVQLPTPEEDSAFEDMLTVQQSLYMDLSNRDLQSPFERSYHSHDPDPHYAPLEMESNKNTILYNLLSQCLTMDDDE